MCFDIVKLTFYSVLTLLVPNTRNINLKKKNSKIWEGLMSSASSHWTCQDLDMCPIVDTYL